MEIDNIKSIIEAILFSAGRTVETKELMSILELSNEDICIGLKKACDKLENINIDETIVSVQSGVKNAILAKKLLDNSLTGFEFAAGIPGTMGGAIKMNAGAHGGDAFPWLGRRSEIYPELPG